MAKAPRETFHCSALDGVALALARGNRRVGRLHRQLGRLVVVVVVILAADRVLEFPQTTTHGAADLGNALRAEEQQSQQEKEKDLPGPDVRHALRVAVWRADVGKDDRE